MNPLHLLEQAERLAQAPANGAPRQADKRRAVSAAYYAMFHAVAQLVGSTLVGAAHQSQPRYVVLYRSVAHGQVKIILQELLKPAPSAAWRSYFPAGGFGADLRAFAAILLNLLRKRHLADYDPSYRLSAAEALESVSEARRGLERLRAAPAGEQALLATLAISRPQG